MKESDTGRKFFSGAGWNRFRPMCLFLVCLVLVGALQAEAHADGQRHVTGQAERAATGSSLQRRQSEKPGVESSPHRMQSEKAGAESFLQRTQSEKAGVESSHRKMQAGSAAAEKLAARMVSGAQKLVLRALEETDAAREAAEKARSYDFTLGFAGDICLADNYIPMQHLAALGSKDISDGIDPRFIEIMRGMDLMWINNEFVYSRRGEPLPGKAWTFCGDPDHVAYLKDLGVDIVGLANNHSFDFGEVSFLDTLSTLEEAKIPYVGAGRTLGQAQAPVYLETNGFTIAYVAASCAEYTIYTPEATDTEPGILWCYDNTRFLESIRTAAANADYVIALPHWGVEHSTVLEEAQTGGAHAYIDAGADAVIGAHPHILQGIEYYKGKPILYSLGNFWFDDYEIDTLVAQLRIKGKRENAASSLEDASVELRLYPGTQTGVYTGLADTEEWKSRILQYLEGISVNVAIDKDGVVRAQ